MKRLKKKTSRFFGETPTADERAAAAAATDSSEGTFDAGIEAPSPALKTKRSWWSLRKSKDEPVPDVPFMPAQSHERAKAMPATSSDTQGNKMVKEDTDSKVARVPELMGKNSSFFRSTPNLPIETPDLPIELPDLLPELPDIPPELPDLSIETRQLPSTSARSSVRSRPTIPASYSPSSARPSISHPPSLHPAHRISLSVFPTVPFTRPPGPPPQRPDRPPTPDEEVMKFMDAHSANFFAPSSTRSSASTIKDTIKDADKDVDKIESESDADATTLSPEERKRRFKRKEYRNDIPLPRIPGHGQYSYHISPLYNPSVFAVRTSKKTDYRTGQPKQIVPRAPYPFTSPTDLPLIDTLWDNGVTSRVERQEDGFFVFIQDELFPPGPMERVDPAMRYRWVMEERIQLVNMASDSEKEEGEDLDEEKQMRRVKRIAKKQKKMPYGCFVKDLVGGGRKFVRDI